MARAFPDSINTTTKGNLDMPGFKNHAIFEDDFFGGKTYTTTVGEGNWKITDTSSSGTPTYASVSPSATGEVALTFDSANEIQNVCLDFGDKLCFDIDNIQRAVFVVKTVASLNAATTLAFGLQSGRNDDTDATTNNAQFKLSGSNAVVCETDDGTTDNDDKSSGVSLVATYKEFVIDFTGGKSDVKFYIDGARVASTTTFSMAAATGSLQPFVQISKTASTNVNSVTVDYVSVECKR
jgi:hypothetical protein